MASITVGNINGNASVNPTSLIYPVNINGEFEDGMIQQNDVGNYLNTTNEPGFIIDQDNANVLFGYANGMRFEIDFGNAQAKIVTGDGTLDLTGTALTAGSAGGASGQHLVLTVNGVVYKIALLTV